MASGGGLVFNEPLRSIPLNRASPRLDLARHQDPEPAAASMVLLADTAPSRMTLATARPDM